MSSIKLYGNGAVDSISMRSEMDKILQPYSRIGIFRRTMRDSNNQPILCDQCRHVGVQHHRNAYVCTRCLGTGYLFQEGIIRYYQWPGTTNAQTKSSLKDYDVAGVVPSNVAVIYVEYQYNPTIVDKIIEVENKPDGSIGIPVIRKKLYDITSIDEYRLDYNKTEYYRLFCNVQVLSYYGQPLYEYEVSRGRTP